MARQPRAATTPVLPAAKMGRGVRGALFAAEAADVEVVADLDDKLLALHQVAVDDTAPPNA
jgi:hypothetical protein